MAQKRAIAVAFTLHGGPPLAAEYPEAAGQTFKRGELVYLNASGYVAEYTDAIDDGTQRLLGVADSDGQNLSSNGTANAKVLIPTGTVFAANITSAGSDIVSAITHPGSAALPFYYDTSLSIVQIDIANTAGSGDWAKIYGLVDAAGETNGRVLFTFVSTALQLAGAA